AFATVAGMDAAPSRDIELEWQLDAQDLRPVLRWIEAAPPNGGAPVEIGAGRTATHVDTYLDTRDRSLDRAGYSLRIRRAGRRAPVATAEALARGGRAAWGRGEAARRGRRRPHRAARPAGARGGRRRPRARHALARPRAC